MHRDTREAGARAVTRSNGGGGEQLSVLYVGGSRGRAPESNVGWTEYLVSGSSGVASPPYAVQCRPFAQNAKERGTRCLLVQAKVKTRATRL